MSSGQFGVLELLVFFGIPVAFGMQQLWALRRERLRDQSLGERVASAEGAGRGDAAQGPCTARCATGTQGGASDGRDSGAA